MNMKKLTLVAVAIMMVSTFAMTAMAADQTRQQDKLKDGSCLDSDSFVDADGDGVCDNYVDADGDGICDNCQGDGIPDGDGVPDRDQKKLKDGSCQE